MTHPDLGLACGGWLAGWRSGLELSLHQEKHSRCSKKPYTSTWLHLFQIRCTARRNQKPSQFSKTRNSLLLSLQYFHSSTFLSLPETHHNLQVQTARDLEIRRMSGKTSEKLSLRVFTSATKQNPGARNHKEALHSQRTFCKQEVGNHKVSIYDSLACTSH